jgi:hypothetical protein
MKYNFKKLLNFRNILQLFLVLLIIVIGYNIFVYLNIFEGAVDLNIVKTVVIAPLEGDAQEWLNIAKIKLTDTNGNDMKYTATSSNGSWSDKYGPYGGYALTTDRLSDTSDSPQSMFHSGSPGCTLTITPTDSSQTLAKITIRNRRDCCQDRLKYYKVIFKNLSNNEIESINLKDVPKLLDPAIGIEDILLSVAKPAVTVPVNNSNSGSIQTISK